MTLKEIKQNPIFQYANILALIGILITIVIYFLQDKRKEITIYREGQIALVDIHSINSNSLSIKYANVDVKNLFKEDFTIQNTGSYPILKSDLIDSLQIKLNTDSKIIDFGIVKIPKRMLVKSQRKLNVLSIMPDLMNPGDLIKINIYYTSDSGIKFKPHMDSRIVDGNIRFIDKTEVSKNKNRFYFKLPIFAELVLLCLSALCLLVFVVAFSALTLDKSETNWKYKLLYILFVLFSLISLAYIGVNELI